MNNLKALQIKFDVKKLRIGEIGNWIISLRPEQLTLGALILSLNRPCISLGDLTIDESKDLGKAFKLIDSLFSQSFKPDKINYLALMMVDNQVHFHVLPRYREAIKLNGSVYIDKCWPVAHNLKFSLDITNKKLLELHKKLSTILQDIINNKIK